MKWHKISDSDYPEMYRAVLVCSKLFGKYADGGCFVSPLRENTYGEKYWYDYSIGKIFISSSDRWTYIDLPTD